MRRYWLLIALCPLLLLAVACAPSTQAFENVNSLEAREKVDADKDLFVLDVRQPEEYAEGYVPGAHLIPLGELASRLDEVPRDQDILVVCRSGGRSSVASALLTEQGFPGVFNLQGGTIGWQKLPAQLHLKVADLRARLPDQDTLVLDVRPQQDYDEHHIPGAVSLPIADLHHRPPDVPKDHRIIVVATTTDEGDEAATQLLEMGYTNLLVLEDGMSAWTASASVEMFGRLVLTWSQVRRMS